MRSLTALAILLAGTVSHARQTLNFGAFEATVATQTSDGGTDVTVALVLPERLLALGSAPKTTACFVSPDALTVTLDGAPMGRLFAGGEARATMISGMALRFPRCAAPQWHLRVDKGTPAVSTIRFELHGGAAEMTIEHLFTRRAIQVQGALKPGAPVTLTWSPKSDVWRGTPRGALVHVYRPNEFSKQVNELTFDDGTVRFTLPDVPAGKALIDFTPGAARVSPRIATCGLRSCAAGQVRAWPVEVVIAR